MKYVNKGGRKRKKGPHIRKDITVAPVKNFAANYAVKRCPCGTKLNSPATVNDAGGGYELRDSRRSGRKVRCSMLDGRWHPLRIHYGMFADVTREQVSQRPAAG